MSEPTKYWRCNSAPHSDFIEGAVYCSDEKVGRVGWTGDFNLPGLYFRPWAPAINDWVVANKEDLGIVANLKGDRAEVLLKGVEKLVTVDASQLIPILNQAPYIPPKNPPLRTPEPRIKPGDQFVRLHDHEYEEYLIWSIPQRFGTPATTVRTHIDEECVGSVVRAKDTPFEYDMSCTKRPSGKITLVTHDHPSGYNWPLRSCAKIGDYLTLMAPPEGDPFANDMAPESKAAIGKVVVLVSWDGVGTLDCASDAGAIFWPARLCKLADQSVVRVAQQVGRALRDEEKGRGPMKCRVHGIRYGLESSCPRCVDDSQKPFPNSYPLHGSAPLSQAESDWQRRRVATENWIRECFKFEAFGGNLTSDDGALLVRILKNSDKLEFSFDILVPHKGESVECASIKSFDPKDGPEPLINFLRDNIPCGRSIVSGDRVRVYRPRVSDHGLTGKVIDIRMSKTSADGPDALFYFIEADPGQDRMTPEKSVELGLSYEIQWLRRIGAHAGSPLSTTDPASTRTPASGEAHGERPVIGDEVEIFGRGDGWNGAIGRIISGFPNFWQLAMSFIPLQFPFQSIVNFPKSHCRKIAGRCVDKKHDVKGCTPPAERPVQSETPHRADGADLAPQKSWIQALYDDRIANRNRDCPPVEERYVEGEFVGLFPKLKAEPAKLDRPSYAPSDKSYDDAAKKKWDEIHLAYRHIAVYIAEKNQLYEELRAIGRGAPPPTKSSKCTCGAAKNEAHLCECPYMPF